MQAIFRELCASKNYSVFYLECQKDVHGKSQWLPLNRCVALAAVIFWRLRVVALQGRSCLEELAAPHAFVIETVFLPGAIVKR